ncbi:NAD(P)/FAD-dependent oxidoreductase (plasmid) [Arthrobacter sp. Z1-9]
MSSVDQLKTRPKVLDAVVVGAGITGIHQLYWLNKMGLAVEMYEEAPGVGGVWFWNRYPGARFDSESYSYGYFFDKELLQDWDWPELFAAQPDIESYMNHVIDRFDLRKLINFSSRVVSAVFDEDQAIWVVTMSTGKIVHTKYLIAATGNLSTPFMPDIPNRELFGGEVYHTGRWPQTPVDFKGKKVAVMGTGSSGVQIVPFLVDEAESLTVFQRTANWSTPLNNRPISADEMAEIKASYSEIYAKMQKDDMGLPHDPDPRSAFEVSEEERLKKYEDLWNSPGLRKVSDNFKGTETDPRANALWTAFISEKVRSIVHDPAVADLLLPKDHGYGGKRPPFVAGFYEAFNRDNVSLHDLRADPIITYTEKGVQTRSGDLHQFDIIVFATGFDAGTGSLLGMNIRGRNGISLADAWSDMPRTLLGMLVPGFPNLLMPGSVHVVSGNVPPSTAVQVRWINDLLAYTEEQAARYFEATEEAADAWTDHINKAASDGDDRATIAAENAWYLGSNIPGKPRHFLLYPGPAPQYRRKAREIAEDGYRGIIFDDLAQESENADDATDAARADAEQMSLRT